MNYIRILKYLLIETAFKSRKRRKAQSLFPKIITVVY